MWLEFLKVVDSYFFIFFLHGKRLFLEMAQWIVDFASSRKAIFLRFIITIFRWCYSLGFIKVFLGDYRGRGPKKKKRIRNWSREQVNNFHVPQKLIKCDQY